MAAILAMTDKSAVALVVVVADVGKETADNSAAVVVDKSVVDKFVADIADIAVVYDCSHCFDHVG